MNTHKEIRQARERAETLRERYKFLSDGYSHEICIVAADVSRLCDALELALTALENVAHFSNMHGLESYQSPNGRLLEEMAVDALSGVAGVLGDQE